MQCSEVRLFSGRSHTVPVKKRQTLRGYYHDVRVALGIPRNFDIELVCEDTVPPTSLSRRPTILAEEQVSGRTFQAVIHRAPRPPTPDATDREIAKRRWERGVQTWRAALRRVAITVHYVSTV